MRWATTWHSAASRRPRMDSSLRREHWSCSMTARWRLQAVLCAPAGGGSAIRSAAPRPSTATLSATAPRKPIGAARLEGGNPNFRSSRIAIHSILWRLPGRRLIANSILRKSPRPDRLPARGHFWTRWSASASPAMAGRQSWRTLMAVSLPSWWRQWPCARPTVQRARTLIPRQRQSKPPSPAAIFQPRQKSCSMLCAKRWGSRRAAKTATSPSSIVWCSASVPYGPRRSSKDARSRRR